MIGRAALAALGALVSAAAAGADAASAIVPGLEGNWTFRSWTYDSCTFGGVASFRPSDEPGLFDCELTTRQVCPDVSWSVRQSCLARQSGNRITVTSTIEDFLEGPATDRYWPDNFVLTLHSPRRMTGSLISHGVHPSEFTREPGAIS